MARKPRWPRNGSSKKSQVNAPPERPALSRRAFLGYGSATLAVMSLPFGGGCSDDELGRAARVIDISGLEPAFSIDVVRPADLLVLSFGFVNLRRAAGERLV